MTAAGEVWITGIGLISSLGEGVEAHRRTLNGATPPQPVVASEPFAPYVVHPLAPVDFARQIPKTSDQRQMERWQRIGVYAAGLALADADVLGDATLLDKTDLCIAAGNGDRDLALDGRILEQLAAAPADPGLLNRQLATGLRPTLYLGELSNLLAGNISIIHKATGSSRTFKGEEMAGVAALEDAFRRIAAGTSEIALVGGALNAERQDLLLNMELCGALSRGRFASVWRRDPPDGGMCLGSLGAFLVVERREHAQARGARPYARLDWIRADRPAATPGAAAAVATALLRDAPSAPPTCVLSGASGVAVANREEETFLDTLERTAVAPAVRAYGTMLGHGLEAHFTAGAALAAIALSQNRFYPPFADHPRERTSPVTCQSILLTGFAHWHGVGLAQFGAVEGARA